MKTFLKILLAVVIVAALCVGVYFVLPERSQMYIKGNIQYRTDDDAKTHVDKIQDMSISDSTTYGDALTKLCKSTAWYYEPGSETGDWTVTFYGTKATIDLTKEGMDGFYSEKPLKIVFNVRNDSAVDITITIGEDTLNDDEKKAAINRIAKAD